jgi:aspartyl-tRNA(Asn)/glutamyl-tRNA(Gln) amidotransferase subunit A
MNKLTEESILSLVSKLKSKEIFPDDIMAECQANIIKFNPKINAFITEVKPEIKGIGGLLLGIPYALKDSYVTKGIKTTVGSRILADYIPQYSATVVEKLNNNGALLLGKTNMDAWGHGASTENTDFGIVHNPWDLSRVAGGSGGGLAAAIASRMCLFGIGEDTGGSIRNPAGWCNITALKVTYGRVSRYGCVAYASSLDTVGPTAKTAEDCAVVLQIIAGRDPFDATSSNHEVSDYVGGLRKDIKNIKIGIPKEFMAGELILAAAKEFEKMGTTVVEVSLPSLKYAVAAYYLIAPSETSSNLARYDGIRYGKDRSNFTFESVRRIMIGTYALSAGYYDEYYKKAQKVRSLIINDYKKIFETCDVVLAPISSESATKPGELLDDPVKNMMADVYTVTTNIAGIPSLALPCGFTQDGLPVGMQLQGKMFSEDLLLRLGYHYQQVSDWHKKIPDL